MGYIDRNKTHTESLADLLIKGLRVSFILVLLSTGPVAPARSPHSFDKVKSLPGRVEGYNSLTEVKERMKTSPLHEIEGIWQLTGDGGSIIAIERIDAGNMIEGATSIYRMAVIASSDISIQPGTVIGYAATSAKRHEYDSRIYTRRSDDHTRLSHPTRNLLKLDDSGSRMTFRPVGLSLRFNWWRLLLPYLYRSLVSPVQNGGKVEDGCVRIYPEPFPPLEPRYL